MKPLAMLVERSWEVEFNTWGGGTKPLVNPKWEQDLKRGHCCGKGGHGRLPTSRPFTHAPTHTHTMEGCSPSPSGIEVATSSQGNGELGCRVRDVKSNPPPFCTLRSGGEEAPDALGRRHSPRVSQGGDPAWSTLCAGNPEKCRHM